MNEPRLHEYPRWVKSQKDLCEALGVSRQDINRHNVPGCPDRNEDGYYDVRGWTEWLIARMPMKGKALAKRAGKEPVEGADGDDQARYEKGKADKIEREVAKLDRILARMDGDLAPVQSVTNAIAQSFGRRKADAYRMAKEKAVETEGKDAEAQAAATSAILDFVFEGVQDGIREAIECLKRESAGEPD
jgi:hypothetical protein